MPRPARLDAPRDHTGNRTQKDIQRQFIKKIRGMRLEPELSDFSL
jgi:hypothetical protein